MQPPSIEVQLDTIVQIQPRTFSGVNKPGGVGVITGIHRDEESGNPTKIDVKYVLGGKESNIEMTYVTADATVDVRRRGTRDRKQDVKMNIGEEKPKKKRIALKDIDCNRKKSKTDEAKKEESRGQLPAGCEMDGEWMFIQVSSSCYIIYLFCLEWCATGTDLLYNSFTSLVSSDEMKSGKLSDYTSYFTKGTTIQFWWDEDKGWLQATLLKDIKRSLSRGMIKWNVEMKFDIDGETFKYCFLPKDKRWKVKIEDDGKSDESTTLKEIEAEKKTKVKRGTSAKTSKQQPAKGSSKKKWKSSKKKEASFTIALDSDTEVNKVKLVGKKGHEKKSQPVDLGLLDKKKTKTIDSASEGKKKKDHIKSTDALKTISKQADSSSSESVKTSSTKEGDAIIVQKANKVGFTFQAKSNFSKPAPSKLFAQKKQDTIPASSFHRSNKKCTTVNANPFTRAQMQVDNTNPASFSLSTEVLSSIREVSSKAIKKSKKSESVSSVKTVGPKTSGAMTVMTGMGRSTTSIKGSSDSDCLGTIAKAQYEKHRKHACDWINSLKEKAPDDTPAKDVFSTSSTEENEKEDQE